ncbi:Rha family transcriptional regulator [Psychrobacillus sp.]|uniref:Rha family transcriptional regulator n=1 Tax=Psychrobacillus sp. TaxID=1871623 RepID=UPI0028BEE1D3|nr:Rha family transcriptional regulator [Psychrobacillus sp.]
MNQLVFVENETVSTNSLVIAEMFGKEHKNVLRDIQTQIEYAGTDFSQLNFEPSEYDVRGKRYPRFNLTEEAFTLVVMSYNTKEAVQTKIKFIQEFKRMKEFIENSRRPKVLTEKEQLRASMKLSLETSEEVEVLKIEVNDLKEKVENQITIDHGEQRRLQRAIGSKVYELESIAEFRPKLFREIYREIKDRFGVASYKDVKRKDLQLAIRYVEAWIPRRAA